MSFAGETIMLSTSRLFALATLVFMTGCATTGSFEGLGTPAPWTPSEALIEERREPLPKARERELQETKDLRFNVGGRGGDPGAPGFRRVLGS